jgi:hypothetical protein
VTEPHDVVSRLVALSVDLPEEKRRALTHDLREAAYRVSPPPGNCGHLSVNVTPNTQAALDLVAENEGVPVTEALRRLVGWGGLVYDTIQAGHRVLIAHDPPHSWQGSRVERIVLVNQ